MNTKSFGLTNYTLKLIAIITMLIDHIGYVLLQGTSLYQPARAIGRIAFPIFCFLITEGFQHTRNPLHYLLRLCLFALISEVPFDLAFFRQPFFPEYQNVYFTLALGLGCLFFLEEMNKKQWYAVPFVALLAISHFLKCDYGIGGVLLICMFYLTKETPWMRLLLCLLILYLFFGKFELYGMIAMVFITLYNGKRGRQTQMVFYWFYPLHLLALYGIFCWTKNGDSLNGIIDGIKQIL